MTRCAGSRSTLRRTNRKGLSLIGKNNHECIMLENGGCCIHPVNPSLCGSFPNKWNFEGWREVCEAKPVPMAEARARGWV